MADQNPRTIPGHPIAWLLLAAATLLRFYHLAHQSIWVDEYTSFLCSKPYGQLTFQDMWENLHGPLHAATIHALVGWMGANTITLRLPTALAGVLTVGVIYRLAERSLGRGGLIAAALATFSPFLIWYSQEARNYAFVVLFASLATWAWVEILQSRRFSWWVVYVVACVAGVLSNLSMLFVIAAHAAHWVWLMRTRNRAFQSVRPWVLYAALVVVAVSPWLWQLWRATDWSILFRNIPSSEPLRREIGRTGLELPYLFFTFCLGFAMGPSSRDLHTTREWKVFVPHLVWLVPAAIFFAALTLKGLKDLFKRKNAFALVMLWIVVPVLLALYVSLRNVKVFNPRYVAVSLPALFLVWTEAFLNFRRPLWKWGAVAVLSVLWGVALANHYWNPVYNKDDVRGASQYVVRNWQKGDYLLTAGAAMPIHFYLVRAYPTGHFWLGYAADPQHLPANFRKNLPSGYERIWVVSCRPHWYDPADNFQRMLERDYVVLDRRSFLGCAVYLIRAGEAAVPPPPGP